MKCPKIYLVQWLKKYQRFFFFDKGLKLLLTKLKTKKNQLSSDKTSKWLYFFYFDLWKKYQSSSAQTPTTKKTISVLRPLPHYMLAGKNNQIIMMNNINQIWQKARHRNSFSIPQMFDLKRDQVKQNCIVNFLLQSSRNEI